MVLSRRTMVILLGSLAAASLVLILAALLNPRQTITPPFGLGILFLLFTLFFLLFFNFTGRKAAERDRRELEQRFSFLVRHIKDYAIFFIDPEGRVMSWNKGAQQIKGYTEAEIIGKPISLFYTEEDNRLGEPFQNLKKALEDGSYESIGLRKRKDGSVFYADVVFTPIYDEKNVLKGFAKITRDVTHQKKVEEDIQVTLRREKELNELKSRFVTLASHEFKTPLSVILSSVSLIEKYPETGMQDKRLKHIHRIKSNVNNLKQILNDFLSLEKLEGGMVSNSPIEAHLIPLTREIIQDMEEAFKEGQQVYFHTEGTPRTIVVDTHLLRNVLNNLLSNAVKYSPGGSSIDCSLISRPASVDIIFKDQGIGIPFEEQEKLFERFFRATNTAGISGTGLGLSIVKRYLDLMGSEIRLISLPGQGSTFTVTLPG
jgi:two-component system, LuxR family, sensor kinase FixL